MKKKIIRLIVWAQGKKVRKRVRRLLAKLVQLVEGEPRTFVIFGAMRSGSNLLQEKLHYFGDIICLGELYNPAYVGVQRPHLKSMHYANWDRNDPGAVARRDADPMGLLTDVKAKAKAEGKILGFRHFERHNPMVRDYLIEKASVKKIILTRNLVDSFVSLQLAKESGQWIKRDDSETEVVQIHFDIAEYEKYVKRTRNHFLGLRRRLEELGQPYMSITYQDVLDDKQVEKVARFVGSRGSAGKQEPVLRKQTSGSLSDKLSNYDDVREYLETCQKHALD